MGKPDQTGRVAMVRQPLRIASLVLVVLLAAFTGCPKSSQQNGVETEKGAGASSQGQSQESDTAEASSAACSVTYVRVGSESFPVSIVLVDGYPLVFTGQISALANGSNTLPPGFEDQMRMAWEQLGKVLDKAGSMTDRIVRLNICVAKPEQTSLVLNFVKNNLQMDLFPAITITVTPLPIQDAQVAFDAIAYVGQNVAQMERVSLDGSAAAADAVVCPLNGFVFFSGQPDKSPMPEAAEKSLAALLKTAEALHVTKEDIVQFRVFLQPASSAPQVLQAMKKVFGKTGIPPVVFTEWIATAPVEIEMIARLPVSARSVAKPIDFYQPPGTKPTPTFSRATLVATNRIIFFPGLTSAAPGPADQQAQDVFDQLAAGLKETGSDMSHLAKATYYVVDKEASDAIDKIRPKIYDVKTPPAASKVTVHGVGVPERTLSVDMIAVAAE